MAHDVEQKSQKPESSTKLEANSIEGFTAASQDWSMLGQPNPKPLNAVHVMALQRAVGNQVVQRMLGRSTEPSRTAAQEIPPNQVAGPVAPLTNHPRVQRKLTVGPADDRYEREADAIATRVMRKPIAKSQLQRRQDEEGAQATNGDLTPITHAVQRKHIQRKAAENGSFAPSHDFQRKLAQSQQGGKPLSEGLRNEMGSRFGADFSNVRVHTGSDSVQLSRDIQAQAFTHGSHIHFNSNKFSPSTTAGKHLLAHELTHVVQQGGASIKTKREPAALDNKIQRQRVATKISKSGSAIQRVLIPEAKRAFKFAIPIKPSFEQGMQLVEHYANSVEIENDKGEMETKYYFTDIENVSASEQKKLTDIGGRSGLFKKFSKDKAKQTPEQEERLKDYMRAYLLTDFATRSNNLRTDKRYPTTAKKVKQRKLYLQKALEYRDKIKPLIEKGVASEESKVWLKLQGFDKGFNVTGRQNEGELLKGPRIDVRSTFIGARIAGLRMRSHLYIVYTGRDGRQFYFRGGPDHVMNTVAHFGEYNADTIDYDPSAPSVTVLTGDAAEAKFDALVEATSIINALKVPYVAQVDTKLGKYKDKSIVALGLNAAFGTKGENCNATAWTILKRAGIPTKKPTGKHPGWGSFLGAHTDSNKKNPMPDQERLPGEGEGSPYVLTNKREVLDTHKLVQIYHDRGFMQQKTKVATGLSVELLQEGRDFRMIRYNNGQIGFIKKNSKESFRNNKQAVRDWFKENSFRAYLQKYLGYTPSDLGTFNPASDQALGILTTWFQSDKPDEVDMANKILQSMSLDLRIELSDLYAVIRDLNTDPKTILTKRISGLSDDELEALVESNDQQEIDAIAQDAGLDKADAIQEISSQYAPIAKRKKILSKILDRVQHTMQLNFFANDIPDYEVVYEIADEEKCDANYVLDLINSLRPKENQGNYLATLLDKLDVYEIEALGDQQKMAARRLKSFAQKLGVPEKFVADRAKAALPKLEQKRRGTKEHEDAIADRCPLYKFTDAGTLPDQDGTPELVAYISWGDVTNLTDLSDAAVGKGWFSFALEGTHYWAKPLQFMNFVRESLLDKLDKIDIHDIEVIGERQPLYARRLTKIAQSVGMTDFMTAALISSMFPAIKQNRKDQRPDETTDQLQDRLPVYLVDGDSDPDDQDFAPTLKGFLSYQDYGHLELSNDGFLDDGWLELYYEPDSAYYWVKVAHWSDFIVPHLPKPSQDEEITEDMLNDLLDDLTSDLAPTKGKKSGADDNTPIKLYDAYSDDVEVTLTLGMARSTVMKDDFARTQEGWVDVRYQMTGYRITAKDWALIQGIDEDVVEDSESSEPEFEIVFDEKTPIQLYDDMDDKVLDTVSLGVARQVVQKSMYPRNEKGFVDVVYQFNNYRVTTEQWKMISGEGEEEVAEKNVVVLKEVDVDEDGSYFDVDEDTPEGDRDELDELFEHFDKLDEGIEVPNTKKESGGKQVPGTKEVAKEEFDFDKAMATNTHLVVYKFKTMDPPEGMDDDSYKRIALPLEAIREAIVVAEPNSNWVLTAIGEEHSETELCWIYRSHYDTVKDMM